MSIYPKIGVSTGEILLPRPGLEMSRWAVIACDQYTSQPEYWNKVEAFVGDAPSTYNLILPEVFLGTPAETERIQSTQNAMHAYVTNGLLASHQGLILVEREVDGKKRRGLMLALDLEKYDFNKGSQTLIRATEGTILDRLPPRMKIRQGASLELPHILVLIDDPERTVIEPIYQQRESLTPLYDFDLMFGSGHLKGYGVNQPQLEAQVVAALNKLADPQRFRQYYGVGEDKGVLLFAMGDGNHSLATAKAIWEKMKPEVGMDHPARYALVEIENVHDEGLEFEPIHRVVFGVQEDPDLALQHYFGSQFELKSCESAEEMIEFVNRQPGPGQCFGLIQEGQFAVGYIQQPPTNLPVGSLQLFLDDWLKKNTGMKIDYVHGDDVVCSLGSQPGHAGFYLPGMAKGDLFKTVILDGALPRKTFSMGEAHEKRFYLECRRIA